MSLADVIQEDTAAQQGLAPHTERREPKAPLSRDELRAQYLADLALDAAKAPGPQLEPEPVIQDCWERIADSYNEAAWIETVHAYPNGLPYCEQTALDLWLWQLAINAQNKAVTKDARSGGR